MQLLRSLSFALCRRSRSEIAGDRILPITHASEGMGWHMQSMRSIRSDLRVALCCLQGSRCERRDVVGMDDVVRESGMIWFFLEQCFQNRTCLEQASIRFICWIFGFGDCQGIENLCLVVGGVFRGEGLHAVAIGDQTLALRRVFKICV